MNKENKFEIEVKAEKLYFIIFDLTTNRKHYPIKFRRLADKLQECALDIYGDILEANALPNNNNTVDGRQKRWLLQTGVITKCNKLLSLTKYSLYAHLISAATSEKWVAMTNDVKFMTLRWRKT